MDTTVRDALLDEIGRLGSLIEDRLQAAERFVAVAGSIAGIGLTLGLFQSQRMILIGLPVAIALIFIFMIQIYTDASTHSGHRKALEEILNARLGEPVLIGQSVVGAQHARRKSVPLSLILAACVWLATVALGASAAWPLRDSSVTDWLVFLLFCLLVAIAIATLSLAIVENVRAEPSAREATLEAYSPPVVV